MKRWGVLIGFLVVAGLLAGGIFMAERDPGFARKLPSVLIDKPVPEFQVPDLLDPSRTVTPSQYRGKVWVLNVWGSWCRECWKEHGYLERLATEDGLIIVGLNWRDEKADAVDMLSRAGNPFVAIGVDPHSDAAVDLGVYGAPESFIIDKKGIIRHKVVGSITPELWKDEVQPLIERLESES
jgi:cytochrome c biogenesis protein CcmG/thiol:disulfide interchange protein DsbE